MLKELEKYRFRGDMHRSAIRDLPQQEALTVAEKERLSKAYTYGRYGTLLVQFPFVSIVYQVEKRVRNQPVDKKVLSYVALAGVYGVMFMMTRAWVWHQCFYSVEDVIKKYVESISVADLQKLESERELGILRPDKDKVYTPKD